MDSARAGRYADKLEHASRRLENLAGWIEEADDDLKTRLACYKAFQEASEALMDVVAMIAKEEGITPKDDYTNIETVERTAAVTPEAGRTLREANGLRNRLVHEYGGLADDVALVSVGRLAPALDSVVGEVREWISRIG